MSLSAVSNIISILASFNRKERFYLIGMALRNRQFTVCPEFRSRLLEKFDLHVPEHAFCAMDYHLDWIYASMVLSSGGHVGEPLERKGSQITATQEDVDLLIAFEEKETCEVVILEAKGASNWSNRQMRSKAERLRGIFGDNGCRWDRVKPHFVMASPSRPRKLDYKKWPTWMKPDGEPVWIELAMVRELKKVTRCDPKGKPCENGTHFKIESIKCQIK